MARPKTYTTKEELREAKRLNEKRRRDKNPEKFKEYRKKYYEENKEKLLLQKKEYHIKNREKRIIYNREYFKERSKNDGLYKLTRDIRSLIYNSFKRTKSKKFRKNTSTEKILGCSLDFFIKYILEKCPSGTSLKDFGRYKYHIDHIIPLSTAKTEEELAKLCHYTNLQPLWCNENLSKSNKILN